MKKVPPKNAWNMAPPCSEHLIFAITGNGHVVLDARLATRP